MREIRRVLPLVLCAFALFAQGPKASPSLGAAGSGGGGGGGTSPTTSEVTASQTLSVNTSVGYIYTGTSPITQTAAPAIAGATSPTYFKLCNGSTQVLTILGSYNAANNTTVSSPTIPPVPTGFPAPCVIISNNGTTAWDITGSTLSQFSCQSGLGDGTNAIAAATYLQTSCINEFAGAYTITGIFCLTDNAGTSTLAPTNGAGTALLTGAVTCNATLPGAAGTQSATTTIAVADGIKFTFVADGTSKQTTWVVKGYR